MDWVPGIVGAVISGTIMAALLSRLNEDFDLGRRSGTYVWLIYWVPWIFSMFPDHRRLLTVLFVAVSMLAGFAFWSGLLDDSASAAA